MRAMRWMLFGFTACLAVVRASEPIREVSKRIDAEIDRKIADAKGSAAPLADDAEFLRRVHLDITGRLPTPERAVEFFASKDSDKRAKLIDALLASPEYGQHFARYWAELFVKRDGELNKNLKMADFRGWLAGEFNKGTGWDKIVATMLTVDDGSAATMFLRANRLNGEKPSPAKVVGTAGALFMGVQYQCAECHDHPYTRSWTQDGFWSMAAFFGRARYENLNNKNRDVKVTEEDPPPPDPNGKSKKVIKVPSNGTIDIPDPLDAKKIRKTVTAKLLIGSTPTLTEKGPYRPIFANWLVEPGNPYFARAAVNRLWSIFFSKGLVSPLDDMNPDNPPSHPELLQQLAEGFRKSGHDYRHVIRAICNSDAYQRTSRRTPDDPDDDNFGRRTVQFLHGEVLLTVLDQVLGVEPPTPPQRGQKSNTSVPTAELFDSGVYDDDPSTYSFGAPQMLRLMNTDVPRRAPAAIARLMSTEGTNEQYLERLYLMTLARRPTNDEARAMLAHVASAETPAKGFEAVLWVLVNSAEFVSNH